MATQPQEGSDSPQSGVPVARALSAEQVNTMLDHLVDGIMVLGFDWRIEFLNAPAAAMLGASVAELEGRDVLSEFPDLEGHPFQVAFAEAMRTGRQLRMVDYFEPLGRWFETRAFPQGNRIVNLFRDVTAERDHELALREQVEQFSEAERIVRFGVWKWEIASGRVHWSDELHRIYGIPLGSFAGTVEAFRERLHPEDVDRVWSEVSASLESRRSFAFRERIVRPDGEVRTLLSQGRVITDSAGEVSALVGVCHDVTARVAAEHALGTSERRMRAIIDNTPALVTVKDLDGRYLMSNTEAERITEVPDGGLVGKLCVDAFPAPLAEEQRARDRLAISSGEPVYDEVVLMRRGSERTFLTITFALPDEDGLTRETCTIATDVTERRQQENEREERERWTEEIFAAVREDRMLVFGQPIFDARSESRRACELLVRLRDAAGSGSIQSPGAFLPAAERFHLIQTIDTWMVRQALRLADSEPLQVNVSALTVCDAEAQVQIFELLEAAPEAARRLVFEVTETASATQLQGAQHFAAEVISRGCRLALDDFGVGFGSFTYLRSLPLDYVKIDVSFVQGLLESADDRRVVQGIIRIAKEFGLETIAEGVESRETLELLQEMEVDLVQGFLLGRPAPLRAFARV